MLAEKKIIPGVRKIAVLRANGLGDFIFVLPALQALRETYPQAEIVLLAKDWHAAFLKNRPSPIDRVIALPSIRGVGIDPDETGMLEDARKQEHFFAAMQDEQFDLAFQLHGGGRYSNPFLLRLGARVTIGLRTPDAALLDRWVPYIYFQSEVARYLEVVALAGAGTQELEPHIAIIERDLEEARRVVPEAGKPLVALHPGAGSPQRCWPIEKFAAVGDALATARAKVVVTGTKAEKALVEGVIRNMKTEAQSVCGRLSLGGLAGLLHRCRVLVSNDSGPLHLGRAAGTCTVGIYWCVNFMTAAPITRTCHRPVISWRLECPICGSNQIFEPCGHRASLVADVAVEDVVQAALDLLALDAS
ncbi:MAG TPA: glycosyltransferase family 9 protein [Ktedonobacteraceae bacterium]|jgi:ADP-heptose:LPS heptosyltransferase|nr:glycosyltransferase family 9 protein [Ktedonobacteraceae bacterium]